MAARKDMADTGDLVGSQEPRVIMVRGEDVVLDRTVAGAFGVETREINQAVARNESKRDLYPDKLTAPHKALPAPFKKKASE